MTTSAHEYGDPEQPLPGTVNQPEFVRQDVEARENPGGEHGEDAADSDEPAEKSGRSKK